ncbi:MAG TPA: bifunctional UDP-N-acetylglucosamine diphosphorylase/glucosamine-1-phosphate N-acetyltransferase GlmU [Gammaproteobacteria bacterium]|nr:bifunctional UDP-N-acetylglucosamine diphosphorylase/glucosamine-1-phosphate N-acetyltransferase GlmU [Gammaproteobacteria bacterium]
MPVSVVVLAAGQGKRMRSALPKVLQPLAGRPMLAHVLTTARALEPAAIHVVYGHGGEQVRESFDEDADVRWCLQAQQLGTGHAVAQAMPEIPADHTVLILYGDVPLVPAAALERLVRRAAEGAVAMLTAELDDPTGYGRVLRDTEGRVTRVVEHKDATEAERRVREINTGLLAVGARDLGRWIGALDNDNVQGEYYLTDIVAAAFRDGREVEGVLADRASDVLGINDRAQLALAERAYQRREAERLMTLGATLADPARLDVRGEVEIGTDVFIDVGVVLEGRVRLGDRAVIGPYCVIKDAALGEDCVVHAHTVIEGLVAARACEIGPFARLRPGVELAAQVKVGNFVEIKKSRIGDGSKVNHLTYVGDASVGRKVNVGAGTITCNYDGANKHRTVIGDNAFIGSGAMLVAPVEIGNDATIGAGSTITKNAPPGELTLARTRQTSVEGWKRPQKKS